MVHAPSLGPAGAAPALLVAVGRDERGAASIEFAFIVTVISFVMLAGVDVADFYVHRMQVESAAHMAAYAGSKACDNTQLPATTNCPGLNTAITTAVQSTSLGSNVTLQSGYPTEGYYCVNNSNALQYVGALANPPADCSAAGRASDQPGDYLVVKTQYTHTPIFNAMNFASMIPTSITGTAMVRLK